MTTSKLLVIFLCQVLLVSSQDYVNRLPRTFIPYNYYLYLEPHLESQKLPLPLVGEVRIFFTCKQNAKVLTLNSHELKFGLKDVKISQLPPNTAQVPVLLGVRFEAQKQFVHFDFDRELQRNFNYSLAIKYTGNLTDNNMGMYAAPYLDNNLKTKYLVATQLQMTYARNLFPGFDEVDMKATFDIVVARQPQHVALANTHITGVQTGPGNWLSDVFARTPIMTPYLVAVAVGELQYLESSPPNSKYRVRVYATERLMPYVFHPNKYYTFPIQKWLETETTLPYTLNKMDHISLSNFGGAMENWGLITYSDSILPVSNKTSSGFDMFTSAYIVAHELAHMWYGDLVTCEWWTHSWTQEAMASYYNFYPLEALGWHGSELHQLYGVVSYMNTDQTNRSTTVRVFIKSPQEAPLGFQKATYDKGGALIRMMGQILTLPVLKLGLTRYLKQYMYKSVTSDQFLQVFTDQAKDSNIKYPDGTPINFKQLLDPWLDQKGFPVLTVTNNNDGTATVSQKRYFNPSNQVEDVNSPYGYKWDVPISVIEEKSRPEDYFKTPTYWLRASTPEIRINVPKSKDAWYIINPDQKFYYKVFYDKDQRAAMSKNIYKLPIESRASIIDDTFALSRNAYYGATDAYDNTLFLGSDYAHNSWTLALKHVYDLEPFFRNETWYKKHNTYFQSKANSVLTKIGYEFKSENETITDTLLRRDVVSAACWFGSPTCLTYVAQKYAEYKKNPSLNSVNANILPIVLCDGVAFGKKADWDLLGTEYLKRKFSPVSDERASLLFGRSCSPRNEELKEIFDELLTNSKGFFNAQDRGIGAQYLAETPYGGSLFWNYMDANWTNVPSALNKMNLVSVITSSWYTDNQLKELKRFIARRTNVSPYEKLLFAHNVIRTEQNVLFYKNNAVELGKWFNKQVPTINDNMEMEVMEGSTNGPSKINDFKMWMDVFQTKRNNFLKNKINSWNHVENKL